MACYFPFHGGAPSLVANGGGGFFGGALLCLFLVGVWWRARRVGVDAHNTMGCIMSVWCGIVFVWG